jgi:N-acetyl-anhydromuramyl-L-alanine amidase AmpD
MIGNGVVNKITSKTARPKMKNINSIVLHRTVSSNAGSAINTTMNSYGKTGFHIVIDKDGTITQVNNFDNRANHVGSPKGKVTNFNSIGIEIVGMPLDKNGNPTTIDKEVVAWEPLTPEQIENTAFALVAIMEYYDITFENIFPHENVSWKTPGEGQQVMDDIRIRLKEILNQLKQQTMEILEFDMHKRSIQERKSISE